MFSITVYVPEASLDVVKQAMFAAGAGRIGNYDLCCWQVRGEGQFRPLPGSQPAEGVTGSVTQLPEYRLEMVCEDAVLTDVISAMRAAHPYEQPAYHVIRMEPV